MNIEIAKVCTELGYPVAGFAEDIYMDARVCIPPMFSCDLESKPPVCGRVLHITHSIADRDSGHFVLNFVVEQEDTGIQVQMTYGRSYPMFFKLPEAA